VREREKESDRERERERKRDKGRQTERECVREREKEREKGRERARLRVRGTKSLCVLSVRVCVWECVSERERVSLYVAPTSVHVCMPIYIHMWRRGGLG